MAGKDSCRLTDQSHCHGVTRDILPTTFDITLLLVGQSECGTTAEATEVRKHTSNDPKCAELGWVCVWKPIANWGARGSWANLHTTGHPPSLGLLPQITKPG